MAAQTGLDAEIRDVLEGAQDVGDDLEFVTKTNLGVKVIKIRPGQRGAVQRVGRGHAVLGRQVHEQRRARRRTQYIVSAYTDLRSGHIPKLATRLATLQVTNGQLVVISGHLVVPPRRHQDC